MKNSGKVIKKLIINIISVSLIEIICLHENIIQSRNIDESIAKNRKGILIVKAGKGDKITVEKLRHEFRYGCAISGNLIWESMPENYIIEKT